MQKLKVFSVGGFAALMIVGCGKMNPSATDSASSISEGVCKSDVKTTVYDEMFRIAEKGDAFPDQTDLASELSKSLKAKYNVRAGDDMQVESMATSIAAMTADVANEVETPSSVDDEEAQLHLSPKELRLRRLTRLELGDHSSPAKVAMQARLASTSSSVKQMAVTTLDCSTSSGSSGSSGSGSTTPAANSLLANWKASRNVAVYGAWKTMAVAYQSCSAASVAPLTTSTSAAVGVEVLSSRTPASGGLWREITNVSEYLSTDPYYNNYSKPASSCYAVTSKPMLYDFGGKPYTSAGELNFFVNAGSGATTSLGVDCSGFIASAQLAAGLKPKSSTAIRASYAGAISSNDFRDPSGTLALDCLQKVGFTSSSYEIQAGDIVAINGHVIMIDTVAADPFGISKITSAASCTTSNISYKNFDFSIIQSSPYKGALGIQRSDGADYLATEGTIATGLTSYAVAACKARFGTSSTPSISTLSVIRHSTSAACASTEVAMTNESCVASCPVQ